MARVRTGVVWGTPRAARGGLGGSWPWRLGIRADLLLRVLGLHRDQARSPSRTSTNLPPEDAPFLRLVVGKPSGVITDHNRPRSVEIVERLGSQRTQPKIMDLDENHRSMKLPGPHEALGMPRSAGPARESAQKLGAFCFPPSLLGHHPHAPLAAHPPSCLGPGSPPCGSEAAAQTVFGGSSWSSQPSPTCLPNTARPSASSWHPSWHRDQGIRRLVL